LGLPLPITREQITSEAVHVPVPRRSRLSDHSFSRGHLLCMGGLQDSDNGSQLLRSRVTGFYLDVLVEFSAHYSGMFPCFLGGVEARLLFRAARALITETRVAAGSMMPSSSPRSAARYGLATL